MKITKPGKKPKDRKWKGHCRKCEVEVEAEGYEIPKVAIRTDPQEGCTFADIQCIACNARPPYALILYEQA